SRVIPRPSAARAARARYARSPALVLRVPCLGAAAAGVGAIVGADGAGDLFVFGEGFAGHQRAPSAPSSANVYISATSFALRAASQARTASSEVSWQSPYAQASR